MPVSVISWRMAGTHDPIQRVECMNAPKCNPLKRDWPKFTKSVNTERNTTSARLIVCLKKLTFALWLNDASYSKSV